MEFCNSPGCLCQTTGLRPAQCHSGDRFLGHQDLKPLQLIVGVRLAAVKTLAALGRVTFDFETDKQPQQCNVELVI